MRKKLLIAADVDPSLHERAAADGRFEIIDRPVHTEEELAAIVGDCEVLVTRSFNRVTRRVIDRAPHLKLIAQGTSGTDNIDHAAAHERGITILNLPGANADAVAELVIGFMIALTRTVPAYTRDLARGVWNRDDCATRHELRHYRLGIVGLGEVGRRVARLAALFLMRVAAIDPYITDSDFAERGATRRHDRQTDVARGARSRSDARGIRRASRSSDRQVRRRSGVRFIGLLPSSQCGRSRPATPRSRPAVSSVGALARRARRPRPDR